MCLFKRSEACFGWTFLTYLLHLLLGGGLELLGSLTHVLVGNQSIKASLLTNGFVLQDLEELVLLHPDLSSELHLV